jgi:hypothetical protein
MKPYITFTTIILLFYALIACKKDPIGLPDTNIPDPTDTTLQRSFKLVFTNMSASWNGPGNLTARVTIENPNKPDHPIHLAIPVLFENQCSTPAVKLPKGNYRVQQLLLNDGTGITRFVIPITGSPKASQVSKPLSVSMVLEEKEEKEVRLEVLPVEAADSPQSYGYTTGAFGKAPDDSQPPMDKRVFIRAVWRVGEVIYDSIPAQLVVKSWDIKGEMDYQIHLLSAGPQQIYLPAKAVRFLLSISKWGGSSELALSQTEVHDNGTYAIEGFVPAKKLKSVVEVRVTSATSTPMTKTDYEYEPNGEIKQRLVWGKREDLSTYLMHKELFTYDSGNIKAIRTYDEGDNLLATINTRYDAMGRVIALDDIRDANTIAVTAGYAKLDDRKDSLRDFRVDAQYRFQPSGFTDYFTKSIYGGTVLHDVYVSNNGSYEEGTYDYDFGINPYVHLRIPDLVFSQYTKHNVVFQRKIRRGAAPQIEPYDFSYTYDSDGYPKELLTKFRSTSSNVHTYTLRTVYTYY